MARTFASKALALVSAAAYVSAHGHVIEIIIDGLSYKGWDLGLSNDLTVGWTDVPDDGPVTTDKYQKSDIICGNGANPAGGHAVVAAGNTVYIQWDLDQDSLGQVWPVEHKGPIIDMLAPCPDSGCESVDKESLEFFTISQAGLIDGSGYDGGRWYTDVLIENQNGWVVQIPDSIAPGFYVLRHEIIALHNAPDFEGGAQNYPQCFNLEITGSGTEKPQGGKPTTFYSTSDPGIDMSIWDPIKSYEIPGPAPIADAKLADQEYRKPTGEGEIRTGSDRVQQDNPPAQTPDLPSTTAAPGPIVTPTIPEEPETVYITVTVTEGVDGVYPAPTKPTKSVVNNDAVPTPEPFLNEGGDPAAPVETEKPSCGGKRKRRNYSRGMKKNVF